MQGDGMNYIPEGKKDKPVVQKGEFVIAAIGLDHGHINGMNQALTDAGATLKWVWDPDQKKMEAFAARFPGVRMARCEEEVLQIGMDRINQTTFKIDSMESVLAGMMGADAVPGRRAG